MRVPRPIRALCCALALGIALPALASDLDTRRQAILDREDKIHRNVDGLSEAERLNRLIDIYFDYTMLEYPEFATYIGHDGDHGRWTDNSIEAIKRRDKEAVQSLAVVRSIDRSQLSGKDRLNYDLLLRAGEDQVNAQQFLGDYMPLTQLNGVHQNVPRMFALMPGTNKAQLEDILSRLEGVPALVAQNIALMKLGLKKGVTPPAVTLRDVPQQVKNVLSGEPLESPLLRPFANIPESVPEKEARRLREAAVKAYEDDVAPALNRLHSFLTESYLPDARESIAMTDLPDGKAWYAFRVQQMTTTDMSPQEIHELGLSEVRRIRGEMDQVIADSGFEGSFEEFLEFLRTDEQFYFDQPGELITAYRDIAKRADAATVNVIGTLPRLPYGVEAVPEYAQKSQTTAYYQPGSAEAGRPGTFFANTYALNTRPKWEMEALTLHEAVPGHHLQLALQQEIEDLAWFRRFGGYTAYIEGWGLYAESLGKEMGFYQDPYSRFGQLTYEMWRAIRLVVDTGMHSLGWTRQRAIDFFKENAGKTEHDIVVEVDRYIVWPGQALAYKIGELKIKALRARAEKALGDRFDLRAFHDAVLGSGALPLTVLETHIDEWIAAQQSG